MRSTRLVACINSTLLVGKLNHPCLNTWWYPTPWQITMNDSKDPARRYCFILVAWTAFIKSTSRKKCFSAGYASSNFVGSRRVQVGSKMTQDRFMLAQVGPKTPKMASKGLPSTPRWGQNGSKMASKLICFSFMVVFLQIASGHTFSNVFWVFGNLEDINFGQCLEQISIIFWSFLVSWLVYALRGLKMPLWLLQDGLLEPIYIWVF